MSEAVVAKRYADALFQLGQEKATLDQLVEEFRVVKNVFQNDNQLNIFLAHPRVNNGKKKQFLDEAFQGVSKDVLNTLKILVDRGRTEMVLSIINHFTQKVNDAKGIAEGKVYSVRKLSDTEKTELENTFAKRFNKQKIQLENVVDPSLIGGVKIRMGNTIIDGSISGKLRSFKRNLKLGS
ncbi:F0F1 ATP synthase subunit delta [Ornithinibacillus sp. L9]|uniref:ATP synthase subunit delta n=1 Tax=Ornithinibacillus caprae TaxID=2678566 RepID=A0A6N8FLQ2_9BACI|nr:F0F1 ATP synthase subunit delta [Ornithinibacillus caprae]MUK89656.1 F0F1 ATP synthase subunit delta [Ornithinibacillus caprae]